MSSSAPIRRLAQKTSRRQIPLFVSSGAPAALVLQQSVTATWQQLSKDINMIRIAKQQQNGTSTQLPMDNGPVRWQLTAGGDNTNDHRMDERWQYINPLGKKKCHQSSLPANSLLSPTPLSTIYRPTLAFPSTVPFSNFSAACPPFLMSPHFMLPPFFYAASLTFFFSRAEQGKIMPALPYVPPIFVPPLFSIKV